MLLVAVYLRTNLTHRQVAPLFGVDKSAVARVIDSLKPLLGLEKTPRAATTGKVFIVDGTLVPTHDATVADASKNYRRSANIQVMIDADTRLTVAVAGPLPGSRHDFKAYTHSGIDAAADDATVMTDGGYLGNDVILPYRKPVGGQLKDWQHDLNAIHKRIRARAEHTIGGMKNWNILRNCRHKGDGVFHAASAVAMIRNLTMTCPP